MGQCKLCRKDFDRLEKSHFLPAGVYRILRDEAEKNPNPWQLTPRGAVQTSRQDRAPLLCRECEQRFSKNGENYVLGQCLREDRRFPLASVLAARRPDLFSIQTSTRIYYAAQIPEINVPALAYFAASIFWRGSIHAWKEDGTVPVRLGPFQERFRQYLLGLEAFPKDCALWVVVREGRRIDRLAYAPIGERKGNVHVYKFPMPGLAFSLTVGKNFPANYRATCLIHGPGNPLIMTTLVDELLLDEAAAMQERRLDQNRRAIA